MEPHIDNIVACDGSSSGSKSHVGYSFAVSTPHGIDVRHGLHKVHRKEHAAIQSEWCAFVYGILYANEKKLKNVSVIVDNESVQKHVALYLEKKPNKLPEWVIEALDECEGMIKQIVKVKGHTNNGDYTSILFKMVDMGSRSYSKHNQLVR